MLENILKYVCISNLHTRSAILSFSLHRFLSQEMEVGRYCNDQTTSLAGQGGGGCMKKGEMFKYRKEEEIENETESKKTVKSQQLGKKI
jgi:hypothetical protein